MKKSFFLFGFLAIAGMVSAQANDFSRFEKKTEIFVSGITTPKVIRFQSSEDAGKNTVLLNQEGKSISHFWTKERGNIQSNYRVESVSSSFEGNETFLIDGDFKTSFTFSPNQEGDKTVLFSFPEKSEISGIFIDLADDILSPKKMSIKADFGDGKMLPILNSIPFDSRISLSKVFFTRLEISFDTPHFLRINEIQLLTQEESQKKDELVFFAEENKTYTLYSNPHFGYKMPSIIEYQPLSVDTNTPIFQMPAFTENSTFNPDFDGDSIPDTIDFCPQINDPKNTDADNNGRGDLCEDPDLDGVFSYQDNCPFVYNPGQSDLDADTIGDKCDTEENRMTENSTYLLWGIFGLVAFVLGFLVWKSFKTK